MIRLKWNGQHIRYWGLQRDLYFLIVNWVNIPTYVSSREKVRKLIIPINFNVE